MLKDKIENLPESPGVYIFKDSQAAIIYIGKAKDLKKRVQTYFSRQLNSKTQAMVGKVADMEHRLTPTEAQAQILESFLIKRYQPQYNISLKDDKSFPWIKISNEEFPLVSICRRKKIDPDDQATYFGPYTNVDLLRQAFKLMRRIFAFRSCKTMPKEPCLYYRLKLCPAPCNAKIDTQHYKEIIYQIRMFLDYKYEELLDILSRRMKEAAAESRFEEAAKIRDQINALGAIGNSSGGAVSLNELEDLKSLAGLPNLPYRIEAFDVSNIQGKSASGSMVSFYKGRPEKGSYRRFRIKSVSGIDDYKMIAEVVSRRYFRLSQERLKPPDLILIDGGRQHLLVALKELEKLKLNIPLISIAKDKENIYTKDRDYPLKLGADTPALNLIRRVRDEAHRFAISYHRLLRKKKFLR
ncbi:MAG: excinuclease ABC subunit UvrC [Candidatus Omnitrophica bacterium]|nr:excinuclease ABC subunit UvrC [Candidatus Omnitrophota bacterium]